MSEPRTIIETTTWEVVGPARNCVCGHQHFARAPGGSKAWAPQWKFCEDSDCRCSTLCERETSL